MTSRDDAAHYLVGWLLATSDAEALRSVRDRLSAEGSPDPERDAVVLAWLDEELQRR